ncbi:MAG: DNA polymerase III subunit alpha [Candidatus Hydrogenedentota bacterium]|nr:MAG: DNA polymerase III subunit alpha [Candidatus Hydrogenedentota bacterium]
MNPEFVHLHLHSHYSLLDAMNRFDELAGAVWERGMRAVALTDHGNLFGAIEFYRTLSGHGVKPILGCEVYVAPESRHVKERHRDGWERGFHLTLLAISNEGYRNLVRLSSLGYTEGFYYNPRVDYELLDTYSEGLIALSGCLSAEVPRKFLSGREKEAITALHRYRDIFGKENFFIELQDHGLEEQRPLGNFLWELSKRDEIPAVATNDVHYRDAADASVHDALLCIGTRALLTDEKRKRYGSDQFYLKSPREMLKTFSFAPEALARTVEIADRADVEIDFTTVHLPKFPLPAGAVAEEEYLTELVRDGLARRFPEGVPAPYAERLEHELAVIRKKGFAGYFLIVSDFISEARRRGIPVGPGRGSAAGSLVSYALGITQIDPLKYDLVFERFLNPQRTALPDIDVDVCQIGREEVIEYVRQRYGPDRVAQIITFGTFGARAVVRDVARVTGVPISETEALAKKIPDVLHISLEDAIEQVEEIRVAAEGRYAELFRIARRIEGLVRHASRHAAGIVIANVPIMEIVPLYRDAENNVVTQYDMGSVEALGLLKVDILGLKTLSVIREAYEMAGIDATSADEEPSFDDPAVYELLSRGDTLGVFQLDSTGIRELIVQMKPETFEDLATVIALYRPGPMNLAAEMVRRKHGLAPVTYLDPRLEPILGSTYGIILYQEQVMRIAHDLAGLSMAEADDLRKAMGKKKFDLMASFRQRFVTGAVERGMEESAAAELFDQMERFAEYGFNKSHAVAYAAVAYETAWLKAHHPIAFMAATLSFEMSNHTKLALYVRECNRMGISLLPPSVNESDVGFRPVPEASPPAIRYGLSAVKNVGVGACEEIVRVRKDGRFESFWDFLVRVDHKKVNKRAVEALVEAGALDGLGPTRRAMIEGLEEFWERSQQVRREAESAQANLFGEETTVFEPVLEEKEEFEDVAAREKRTLGVYLNGHPLERRFPALEMLAPPEQTGPFWMPALIASVKMTVDKRGKPMAYLMLEGPDSDREAIVFASVYEQAMEKIREGNAVFVLGRLDAARLLVDNVLDLDEVSWCVTVLTAMEQERLAGLRKILKSVETSASRGAKAELVYSDPRSGRKMRFRLPTRLDPNRLFERLRNEPEVTMELRPAAEVLVRRRRENR